MNSIKTLYFEQEGKDCTEAVLNAVSAYTEAESSDINTVIVASTKGKTVLKTAQVLSDTVRIIAVPFQSDRQAKWGAPTEEIIKQCKRINVEFLPDEPQVRFLDREKPDIVNAWRVLSSLKLLFNVLRCALIQT